MDNKRNISMITDDLLIQIGTLSVLAASSQWETKHNFSRHLQIYHCSHYPLY